MKNFNFHHLSLAVLSVLAAGTLFSCSDILDDDDVDSLVTPNAIVTVKEDKAGQVTMQVDDRNAVYPVNLQKMNYGKEFRAYVNWRSLTEKEKMEVPVNNMAAVYVNWLQDILTKPMAEKTPDDDNAYGDDPVEIVNDWETNCEDGYLTLRIRTGFSGNVEHTVNLVQDGEGYDVVLHHNAHGDSGKSGDTMAAFRLDKLPDTGGETVDLKLRYMSFTGWKTISFKYRTRVD